MRLRETFLWAVINLNVGRCGNIKLKRVVSLGYQPLANNLLNKKDEKCELYPLEVNYCDKLP